MTYRTLAWAPILLAAVFLATALVLGPSSWSVAVGVEVELAKVLWLGGALAAARVFEPGDYLRRGWQLLATGVVAFFLRDATYVDAVQSLSTAATLGVLRGVLVVGGNAAQVGGVWVLARVWSAAGLDDAVRGQRRGLFAAGAVCSAILLGPSIAHDAASAFAGNLEAVPHLASDLGDAMSFVLLAAMVRTALALRGGVVFWTWSLFAAGQVAWMLFDGARTLAEHVGSVSLSSPWVESLRIVGAAYFCAAGLAQRWVVSARFPVDTEGSLDVADRGKPA